MGGQRKWVLGEWVLQWFMEVNEIGFGEIWIRSGCGNEQRKLYFTVV